jgi:hypothetical protein
VLFIIAMLELLSKDLKKTSTNSNSAFHCQVTLGFSHEATKKWNDFYQKNERFITKPSVYIPEIVKVSETTIIYFRTIGHKSLTIAAERILYLSLEAYGNSGRFSYGTVYWTTS